MKDRTQSRDNERTGVELSTSRNDEIDHHKEGIDTLTSVLGTNDHNTIRRKLTQLLNSNLGVSFVLGFALVAGWFAIQEVLYMAEVGVTGYVAGPEAGSEGFVAVLLNTEVISHVVPRLKPVAVQGLTAAVLLPGFLVFLATMGLSGTSNISQVLRGYELVTPSPTVEDNVSVTIQSTESNSQITISTSTRELKQAMDRLYPETTTTTTPASALSAASSADTRVSIVEFHHARSGVSISDAQETHTIERLIHTLGDIDADWTLQVMVGTGVKPYDASYTDEELTPVTRALASSEAREFDPDEPELDPVWMANLRLLVVYDENTSASVRETLSALAGEGVVTIPGTAPIRGTHRDIPVSALTDSSSSTGGLGDVREKVQGDTVSDVVADIEDRTIRTKRRYGGQLRSQTTGIRVPKAGLRSLLEVREDVFDSIDAEFASDPYGETADSMTRDQEETFLQDADSVQDPNEDSENDSGEDSENDASEDNESDSTTSPGDAEQ